MYTFTGAAGVGLNAKKNVAFKVHLGAVLGSTWGPTVRAEAVNSTILASSTNLVQIQHVLFHNLLLGGLGGHRRIVQYSGLLHKPVANLTDSL